MAYVDGFLLVVPKRSVQAYTKMAKLASKIFREHGAIEYRECVADDIVTECGLPFPRLMKLKSNETAVFAWVVYKSRAHRDRANEKILKDPRMNTMMAGTKLPFDFKRMSHGGFKVVVDA